MVMRPPVGGRLMNVCTYVGKQLTDVILHTQASIMAAYTTG
jgi:hypothetical protein